MTRTRKMSSRIMSSPLEMCIPCRELLYICGMRARRIQIDVRRREGDWNTKTDDVYVYLS